MPEGKTTSRGSTGGFIITADWHVHTWREGGEPHLGINGRLVDILRALRELIAYAITHQVKTIYQLGDVFHLKRNIPTQAYDQLYDLLSTAARDGLEFVFLVGNHDRENDRRDSVTILPFAEFAHVIDEPLIDQNVGIVYLPWLYDQARIIKTLQTLPQRKEWHMLLFHGELDGASVGPSDYILKSKLKLNLIKPERFNHVFAGHLHKRQLHRGVWYPGSLVAKDFGEPELDKGFIHVTDEQAKIVTVQYPAFRTLDFESEWDDKHLSNRVRGQFVKCLVTEERFEQARQLLERFEPRYLRFVVNAERKVSLKDKERIGVQSLDQLIDAYLDDRKVSGDTRLDYKRYALDVLNRVS